MGVWGEGESTEGVARMGRVKEVGNINSSIFNDTILS